jgi:hypothetical protein
VRKSLRVKEKQMRSSSTLQHPPILKTSSLRRSTSMDNSTFEAPILPIKRILEKKLQESQFTTLLRRTSGNNEDIVISNVGAPHSRFSKVRQLLAEKMASGSWQAWWNGLQVVLIYFALRLVLTKLGLW